MNYADEVEVNVFLRGKNREWIRSERDKSPTHGLKIVPLIFTESELCELQECADRYSQTLEMMIEDFTDSNFIVDAEPNSTLWKNMAMRNAIPRNLVVSQIKNLMSFRYSMQKTLP